MCVCACVALFRKGLACVKTSKWSEAVKCLELLLSLDPNNKKGRELLSEARENLTPRGSNSAGDESVVTEKKRGRRLKIEVENSEEDEENRATSASLVPGTSPSPIPEISTQSVIQQTTPNISVQHNLSKSVPMPTIVNDLKEKGNELFRCGQYGEASHQYTRAMDKLEQGKG